MQSRKQIGWRERVIVFNGKEQVLRVRVMPSREQRESEIDPIASRDDSGRPGQRYMRTQPHKKIGVN